MDNTQENIKGYFKESSDLKVTLRSDEGFIESVVRAILQQTKALGVELILIKRGMRRIRN
ncbi:MAG: hypothetical protein Q8R20_03530 [Nanoarchaeota archaeon]|nr:hypothetical protein [Nanoarchaeota archaeon]